MNCFDDICFAEAVFTDENVGIGLCKIEFEGAMVAEIFDLQF